MDKEAPPGEDTEGKAKEIKEYEDEFAQGENNIYVDELSDDGAAASQNDGQKQRGFEKSKFIRNYPLILTF